MIFNKIEENNGNVFDSLLLHNLLRIVGHQTTYTKSRQILLFFSKIVTQHN